MSNVYEAVQLSQIQPGDRIYLDSGVVTVTHVILPGMMHDWRVVVYERGRSTFSRTMSLSRIVHRLTTGEPDE